MRESGTWNGEVGSGGETAKTTTERTDGRTTIRDRWISGRTDQQKSPSFSRGHSQNRFPYEREERWFPKRSPGQAGRQATLSAAKACFPNRCRSNPPKRTIPWSSGWMGSHLARLLCLALMRDTVKIADRGGHLKRTPGPRRQGGPRSPDWRTTRLRWVVGSTT